MATGPGADDETGNDPSAGDADRETGDRSAGGAPGPDHDDPGRGVDDGGDDREWKFSVDDFPTPGEPEEESSNVAGTLERDQPLEPGNIDRENAFFVALGVLLVLALIAGALFGF